MLEGLLFFALQRQQLSQALVSSGKVSADPDSLFKRFRRVVITPLGGIKATQGIVGFRRFGRQPCSFLQRWNGFLDPPLPNQRDA